MARVRLPDVTLCAVTSVNVVATIQALSHSLDQIAFGSALLLTDALVGAADERLQVVSIPKLASGAAYSEFMLSRLIDFIDTPHCMVVQWDGFVLDASRWDPAFLDFDYIGAPWPQFRDGHDVGNGGFSLRSRKLLEACRDPKFKRAHPEDVAICRSNRDLLEREHALRFAPVEVAQRFSFERAIPSEPTLGFHGVFNLSAALGPDRFWQTYCSLDDKSTGFVDYGLLMKQLGAGPNAGRRRTRLSIDRLAVLLRR